MKDYIELFVWNMGLKICVGGLRRFNPVKGIFRILCFDVKMRLSFKYFASIKTVLKLSRLKWLYNI